MSNTAETAPPSPTERDIYKAYDIQGHVGVCFKANFVL